MTAPRLPSALAVLLASVGCQPAPGSDGDGEALASISARLDATEERLSTIESKLDALTSTVEQTRLALQPVSTWVRQRKAHAEAEDERQREQSPQARDPDAGPEAATERLLEAATEGIQCEGLETPKIECTVDRALVDQLMADPALLARQARVVPRVKDGAVLGYRLFAIRRESLPQRLGFENGDTLTAADGKALDSIDQAMKLFTELRRATRLELSLERRGKTVTLVIEFVE